VDIAEFDFELPASQVAQEPLEQRDASRLLVLERASGLRHHRAFRDLPDLLDPGDLIVANRSRVLPARLIGRRAGGGQAEILLLRPAADRWHALVRPGRRLRAGAQVVVPGSDGELLVRIDSEALPPDGRREVSLWLGGTPAPDSCLDRFGHMPLPPYIRRPDTPADAERYQTVYAREQGSVAAPTAGLHFTPELLDRLATRGIARAELTLHVGPGTFKPVTVSDISRHRVDPEPYDLPEETARAHAKARSEGHRVIAVGTTTTRTLEAARGEDGTLRSGSASTDLVIVPGYRFQTIDGLITNFHLPRSSLLLLVAAFAGRELLLDTYREAVREGYRFYSYGDAMLIV
jgi:S-adenosylmethionine:tRNA ribosyltransferase-isomerase